MEGSGYAGVVLAASGTHVARGACLPVCLVAHRGDLQLMCGFQQKSCIVHLVQAVLLHVTVLDCPCRCKFACMRPYLAGLRLLGCRA